MTKVISGIRPGLALCLLLALTLPGPGQDPSTVGAGAATASKPAESLYLQLRSVGLDPSRVYRARDINIDRAAIHISLDDGTLGFTKDVAGRVTGAFFEGDGEVLLSPPNQVERASMALFTGAAILEERFVRAYLRFNDDTYNELLPLLKPADYTKEFVDQWNETARNYAALDALRLLVTFSRFLPAPGDASVAGATPLDDRMLHARVQGRSLGAFDLDFDSTAAEQVRAGQLRTADGESYYDVWTSFAAKNPVGGTGDADMAAGEEEKSDAIDISSYKIRAEVRPPTDLQAEATLQVEVHRDWQRALLFELSRHLLVERVQADSQSVEFIQNPSLEGTQLSRRGDDIVAVVFPHPLRNGEHVEMRFDYRGQALSEAGSGLLYVGARGIWYPNRGPAMSNFDLEFHYPANWTLVATGKRRADETQSAGATGVPEGEQVSRWASERPIPFAGFNLGKYRQAMAHAEGVLVQTYATSGVERTFPPGTPTVLPRLSDTTPNPREKTLPLIVPAPTPSPARNEQKVADQAAQAVDFFARRFGPYPYGTLALTQMPGELSQGWPGLVFLSSFAFLSPQEKSALHLTPMELLRSGQLIAHETAHQWWGDLVLWKSYRDQWLSEGLAEYSSLMLLESEDPGKFHQLLDDYRGELLHKNKDGAPEMTAGPVTLGTRLSSSHFPAGYNVVTYGRGAWLFHMLRTMLQDGEAGAKENARSQSPADDSFSRALHKLRDRYQGKALRTDDVLHVFEEELPRSLWYDGHKSLDWFLQGWIKGTAVPSLELENVKYADHSDSTLVSGTIRQSDAPADLVTSVPVYAARSGRKVLLGRIFADGDQTTFRLKAPAGTRKVVLDPNQTVLARIR